MSAGIWLTRPQVASCYDLKYDTVSNWVRRGRVEVRVRHGVQEVNPESVDRYLRERGSRGQHTGAAAAKRRGEG